MNDGKYNYVKETFITSGGTRYTTRGERHVSGVERKNYTEEETCATGKEKMIYRRGKEERGNLRRKDVQFKEETSCTLLKKGRVSWQKYHVYHVKQGTDTERAMMAIM